MQNMIPFITERGVNRSLLKHKCKQNIAKSLYFVYNHFYAVSQYT